MKQQKQDKIREPVFNEIGLPRYKPMNKTEIRLREIENRLGEILLAYGHEAKEEYNGLNAEKEGILLGLEEGKKEIIRKVEKIIDKCFEEFEYPEVVELKEQIKRLK